MKPYNWNSNSWEIIFAKEYATSHICFSNNGHFISDIGSIARSSMDNFMFRSGRGKMGKRDGRVVKLYFGSDLTRKEIGKIVDYKESEIRKVISDFFRYVQLEYESRYREEEKKDE